MMLSQAARIYDRSKKIQPLNKKERQKMYSLGQVSVQKKVGEKKFSPFNTVSRDARDSYLLRVTQEPNPQTNYNLNERVILPLNRRPTVDRAKFERIIGDLRTEDFRLELPSDANHRCFQSQALSPQAKRPLTVRDHQKWRKTNEHFDFVKQQSTKRFKLFPKLSLQDSTNISFMKSLKETIQSNYNNYERFSFRARENRAHSFRSDFGHEYLKEVEDRQKSPEYDIIKSNESITRMSMAKPKVSIEFDQFKDKIATRFDRNDPQWYTRLQYEEIEESKSKTIAFDQLLDRKPNDIHSKYPIRLSLQKIIKLKGA